MVVAWASILQNTALPLGILQLDRRELQCLHWLVQQRAFSVGLCLNLLQMHEEEALWLLELTCYWGIVGWSAWESSDTASSREEAQEHSNFRARAECPVGCYLFVNTLQLWLYHWPRHSQGLDWDKLHQDAQMDMPRHERRERERYVWRYEEQKDGQRILSFARGWST